MQSVPATEYGAEGRAPDRSLDVQANCAVQEHGEYAPMHPEQGRQRNHTGGYPLQVEARTHQRAAQAAASRNRAGKHAVWTARAIRSL